MREQAVRPIDANEIRGKLEWAVKEGSDTPLPFSIACLDFIQRLDATPTLKDYLPVVRAHWERVPSGLFKLELRCSECHCTTSFRDKNLKSPICPWCGARMDGDGE